MAQLVRAIMNPGVAIIAGIIVVIMLIGLAIANNHYKDK